MVERIKLNSLIKYIDSYKYLVVGSPLGVGFSTYIAECIAQKMFFSDEFFALVLTDSRRDKINMAYNIEKAFEYYEYPVQHDIDSNMHYIHFKKGGSCGACILNYDEFSLDKIISAYIDDHIDLLVIDKDDFSNYLYSYIDEFIAISKTFVYNTYDLPQSVFYTNDSAAKKIVVSSEYSKENLKNNYGRYPTKINYDRKILGKFEL
jgi:hypothetical protein